jgi:hypothetical protein
MYGFRSPGTGALNQENQDRRSNQVCEAGFVPKSFVVGRMVHKAAIDEHGRSFGPFEDVKMFFFVFCRRKSH